MKDNRCAGGQFFLAVVLEPPDGGGSGSYAEADAGADGTGDDGSCDYGAGGGEADGSGSLAGMGIADDGAFGIDV